MKPKFLGSLFFLGAWAAILVAPTAYALDPCANPGATTCKPCDLVSKILGLVNGPLLGDSLDPDVKNFVNLLAGDVADLDGDFLINDRGPSLIASLTGDDIKDVSCQMWVIYTIMSNPTRFPAGSILPSDDLKAAFIANDNLLRAKIGTQALALFDVAAPQLVPFLAYLALLGTSADTVVIDPPVGEGADFNDSISTHGHGSLGIIQALLTLLNGIDLNGTPLVFADPVVRPGEFQIYGDLVGANADLDGDGFSNLCEYRHFKRNLCVTTFPNIAPADNTTVDFATAVLDPAIMPVGCYEVPTADDDCKIEMSGANVAPPTTTEANGSVRYRHFKNTQTGADRYQINFLHTVASALPSAKIMKGRPGEAGTVTIVDIPKATPEYWELFLGPLKYQTMKTTPNYFEVTGLNGDTPPVQQTIRGDNTCLGFAPPPPVPHSADTDGNFKIDLSEFTLVIQMLNSGALRCVSGGYGAGVGDQSCAPHNSDYNPQDWKINLPELLRLIQLYTAGSYDQCIGGSEDGYCISVP